MVSLFLEQSQFHIQATVSYQLFCLNFPFPLITFLEITFLKLRESLSFGTFWTSRIYLCNFNFTKNTVLQCVVSARIWRFIWLSDYISCEKLVQTEIFIKYDVNVLKVHWMYNLGLGLPLEFGTKFYSSKLRIFDK